MSETTQNDTKKPKGFQPGNKYGKRFTEENQPSGEAKSKGWQRKKIIDEYADGIIEEAFGQVFIKLKDKELSNKELLEVFKSAIDMSGKKVQKQEIELPEALSINVITAEEE